METSWYDLFSRGARDWLRHNNKVRDAVKEHLKQYITSHDVLGGGDGRTVLVPVKLLEHARFRLRDPESRTGAGQGEGQPGQILRPGQAQPGDAAGDKEGGTGEGEVTFVLELKVEEILDWMWEEMQLPELKPRRSSLLDDAEYVREGWDRRGSRSRLDRRRTVKEAVKRRAIQHDPLPFAEEDLRFRQLVRRRKPATDAAVMFALDVSGSMGEAERVLAKTFFFLALHGLRRRYPKVATAFLAHTMEAWEFSEEEFFHTSGTGGTAASSVFGLAHNLIRERFDPGRYNLYLFYASDGENAPQDHDATIGALRDILPELNYLGYFELRSASSYTTHTEISSMLGELRKEHAGVGVKQGSRQEDVWNALRDFFRQQAGEPGVA
jgi:uncharacterized sporulation protein YeaH/YhbH (DUF444 family)